MTTTIIEIGTLINRSPEIRAGRPTIVGTGVTVRRLVSWYKLGLTPEEILNRIGHPNLDLAKIYAALTYYHANREEIEADLAQEEAEVKQFKQEWCQSQLNR
ncbi:MAG: DUF433 domain-containing protein [Symploca sp. SIO1B1]|nr:DUF433 domain-containing protein [Symploca sp. SIO1B1]